MEKLPATTKIEWL